MTIGIYWNTIHPKPHATRRSGPPKVSQMPWFTSPAWNKWTWSWVATRHDVCCQVVLTKAFAKKTCWTNKHFNNLNHSDSSCLFQSILPLEYLEQEACLLLSFNYLRQHVASPSITHNKRFLFSTPHWPWWWNTRLSHFYWLNPSNSPKSNTRWKIEGNLPLLAANCCHVSSSDTLGLSGLASIGPKMFSSNGSLATMF
jgi:hypothetical protein